MTQKQKNPIKQMAMQLAHQMDDERRCYDEILPEYKREEIRICGRELRTLIFQKGYDISTLLHLAEEYKTLTFEQYRTWFDN